jgi:homoserine O-acetyltransferase
MRGWLIGFLLLGTHVTLAQDGAQRYAQLGRCRLESGKVIRPCRVGYRVYGDLQAQADRVVLGLTWYNGTSDDFVRLIGREALIEGGKRPLVVIDAFGNGVSSSPSNSISQHGARFPEFTIRDMVAMEYRVATEVLRLKHVYAVAGLSMGGIQTFQWVVQHPEFMDKAVTIVGTPQMSTYDRLIWGSVRRAIEEDTGYAAGRYTKEPALTLTNEILAVVASSPAYVARKVPAKEGATFVTRASAPSKLDANDRLWQLKAIMTIDVTGGSKTLEEVAAANKVPMFIATAEQDHLVDPTTAMTWAQASGVTPFVSHGDCGHGITECDGARLATAIQQFLAKH